MKTYPSPLCLVEVFHLTYGHKIRATSNMNEPERALRVVLIKEEVEELSEAFEQKDFIEVIDALADIIYVVYGAALTHGLPIDDITGNSDHTSLSRTAKEKAQTLPAFPQFRAEPLQKYIPKIETQLNNFIIAGEENNTDLAGQALGLIAEYCFITSWELGVDLDPILEEVQASNMSKLGEDGKPVLREDGKILKGPNFFVPNIEKILQKQGY